MNIAKAVLKFAPVFVLAGLMIGGQDAMVAAPIAYFCAVAAAMLTEKKKWNEILDASMDSVKNILVALFVLMMAYVMANCFMGYGVGASVVLIALKLGVTAKTVAAIGLVCTSLLSVATGTSWGTFAACAPIFMWLSHIVGGNMMLTASAIAGGACFGDCIGLISDTTIVSSGIQGVQVVDRVRHQGPWAIICLILAGITFFVTSSFMGLSGASAESFDLYANLTPEAIDYLAVKKPVALELLSQVDQGVALYMCIPLIIVIVLAITGFNTFACIGSGIVSSFILGTFAGTAGGLQDFLDNFMFSGIADAGSWVIPMMMWVAAFGGVLQLINAFEPLAKLIVSMSKNVRNLLGWNAVLCLLGNATLSDEMAQIVTVGPIVKQITDDHVEASEEDMYTIRLRNALFGDAMGVFGSQLIPWHVYLGFYVGIVSAVYPLQEITNIDFIRYNFMAMIAVTSLLFLTFTGFDRFIPQFKLPKEPDVRLKK